MINGFNVSVRVLFCNFVIVYFKIRFKRPIGFFFFNSFAMRICSVSEYNHSLDAHVRMIRQINWKSESNNESSTRDHWYVCFSFSNKFKSITGNLLTKSLAWEREREKKTTVHLCTTHTEEKNHSLVTWHKTGTNTNKCFSNVSIVWEKKKLQSADDLLTFI